MDAVLDVLTNPYYIQVMTMVGISLIAALGLLDYRHNRTVFLWSCGICKHWSLCLRFTYHSFAFAIYLEHAGRGLAAALCGILLGYPSLRLTGDYLGITTLGFGEIVRVVFINMKITGSQRSDRNTP